MGNSLKKLLVEVYKNLLKHFGKQNWWPVDLVYHLKKKTNPFDEIVIGAILTQNTSWRNVEKALKRLKENGKLSLRWIEEVPLEELQELIKPSGFYKQKANRLKEVAKFIRSLKGAIPKREDLLGVKGIGNETADVILLYGYHRPEFVIDKYTLRWLKRFLGVEWDYSTAKGFFEENLPPNVPVYKEFHALIDELAKNYCKAKRMKCKKCPLARKCRFRREEVE